MADVVVGKSSLPPATHRKMLWTLQLPLPHHFLPNAKEILSDAAILDAAQRVLGRTPRPDPCCHVHESGPEDGDWHEDDYCGELWPFPMAILCYYPQDVTPDMGPTMLRVGDTEVPLLGPAGTFCVMAHDTVHRASANRTGAPRYMMKFLFKGAAA